MTIWKPQKYHNSLDLGVSDLIILSEKGKILKVCPVDFLQRI